MDTHGPVHGVRNPDDVGVFDVFVVQQVQDGYACFDVIILDAVAVNEGHIQPVVGITLV